MLTQNIYSLALLRVPSSRRSWLSYQTLSCDQLHSKRQNMKSFEQIIGVCLAWFRPNTYLFDICGVAVTFFLSNGS